MKPLDVDVFDWLKLPAVIVAEVLELAVNVWLPDIDMRPETEIVPVWEPPANDPPESDIELGLNEPLPGVYVPRVMLRAPPIVIAPVAAVKFPPLSVRSPVVLTVTPLETVVVPPLMVIEPTADAVPKLVSSVQDPLMTTSVPAGAPLVPGMQPEQGGAQIQRPELLQLLRLVPAVYLAVDAAAGPLNIVTMAPTRRADLICARTRTGRGSSGLSWYRRIR